jgi:hypothetical protein
MGARRQAREAALQLLYLVDVGHLTFLEASMMLWYDSNLPPRSRKFANELAEGTLAGRDNLGAWRPLNC